MSNDLKYGLVLGGVILLVFVGYLAISGPSRVEPAGTPQEEADREVTTDVDMFEPPPVEEGVTAEEPREVAELRLGGPDEEAAGGRAEEEAPPVAPLYTRPGETIPEPEEEIGAAPGAEEGAAEPRERGAPQTYTIRSGDNLSKIAARFYGDAEKRNVIYEANRDVISDPNVLSIGTTIKIPALAAGEPAAQEETAAGEAPRPEDVTSAGRTHVIKKSDSLWKLAVEYYGNGTEWKKIRDANPDKIDDPNNLPIGVEIVIP